MAASILPTLGTGASAYGQFIPAGPPQVTVWTRM